ncbi:MAG: hypothetical protein KDG55_13170 [Rhodocyclaceae bacterium]|nr:hypothetical protein [Rhodocyclaceae bacterium]
MNTPLFLATLITAAAAAACTSNPYVASNGPLTAPDGRSLYTFDKDQPGQSRCDEACSRAWPPYAAAAGADKQGALKTIRRADGSLQWALDDKPLYFFAGDAKPGDANGDGKGGVWHLARAGGSAPAPATTSGYGYGSGGYQ